MSNDDTKNLIDHLQQKCRFWKRVAITAISVLVIATFFGFVVLHEQGEAYREKIQELESAAGDAGPEPTEGMGENEEDPNRTRKEL